MEILELYDNRVLLKLHEQEKVTKGGIIIPDNATSLPKSRGTVVMTGPGHTDDKTGEFFPMTVRVGDIVSFGSHICNGENEVILDFAPGYEEKFYLVREVELEVILDMSEEYETINKRFFVSDTPVFKPENISMWVPNSQHITITGK